MHVREISNAPADVVVAKPPTFGHSGWLWNNSYLLYDKETDSLWHHLSGRALSGPLRGATLRRLPVSFMTFGSWRTAHPRSLVLPRPERDTDASAAAGPVPEGGVRTDADPYAQRNARVQFGYGIDVPAGPAAPRSAISILVPLDTLTAGPIETDAAGGIPLVVVATEKGAAAAFDRRVEGKTLSFIGDTEDGRPVLRAVGGKRAWWAHTGAALPSTDPAPNLSLALGSVWEIGAWRMQHPKGSEIPRTNLR